MSGPVVVPKLLSIDELAEGSGSPHAMCGVWSPRGECRC